MRILAVTNMYPTDTDPTFGTFVGDQVAALRSHPRVERCDVVFIDGRASRWNYLIAGAGLLRTIRHAKVDVIHAHYGLTGFVATLQRRVPVVVTYHGSDLERTWWQRQVSRIAYRRAADNICVSVRAMRRLPGPAHHLTCGIDTELFVPRERDLARRSWGIAPDELALLFPSSPERPVKAYPRFRGVVDELRARGHRVRELHLRDVTREEVPTIMAAADVMVMTSLTEGAPVTVMEALACGLGVVATPVGDVPVMLASAANARVLRFDAVSFASAVESVLAADPGARRPDPSSAQFASAAITDRLVEILAHARTGQRPLHPVAACT